MDTYVTGIRQFHHKSWFWYLWRKYRCNWQVWYVFNIRCEYGHLQFPSANESRRQPRCLSSANSFFSSLFILLAPYPDEIGCCRWSISGDPFLFIKYSWRYLNILDVENKTLILKNPLQLEEKGSIGYHFQYSRYDEKNFHCVLYSVYLSSFIIRVNPSYNCASRLDIHDWRLQKQWKFTCNRWPWQKRQNLWSKDI